jgi:hypothetical protein
MQLKHSLLGTAAFLAMLATRAAQAQSVPGDPCAAPAALAQSSLLQQTRRSQSRPDAASHVATLAAPLVQQLIAARFAQLEHKEVRVRTFNSDYEYFRTRFSLSRFFLFRRMRYFVEVNPRLLGLSPPADGVCAILGHELTHIASMSHGNRLRLFGLVRLASSNYMTRFERRADLEAIRRGFAPGLKDYRRWIYSNVPAGKVARKKRDYFTPEEIDALVARIGQDPTLMDQWMRHVPLNEQDIAGVTK